PLADYLCEDVPAWWLLKKKRTMYHTGLINSRAVRPLMSFMLSPLTTGEYIKQQEPIFRDIQAYLLSLEPPKYPFALDEQLAARGKELFAANCTKCHGSYGRDWTYPNKLVPLDVVGTDPSLAQSGDGRVAEMWRKSWFGQEKGPGGEAYPFVYQ